MVKMERTQLLPVKKKVSFATIVQDMDIAPAWPKYASLNVDQELPTHHQDGIWALHQYHQDIKRFSMHSKILITFSAILLVFVMGLFLRALMTPAILSSPLDLVNNNRFYIRLISTSVSNDEITSSYYLRVDDNKKLVADHSFSWWHGGLFQVYRNESLGQDSYIIKSMKMQSFLTISGNNLVANDVNTLVEPTIVRMEEVLDSNIALKENEFIFKWNIANYNLNNVLNTEQNYANEEDNIYVIMERVNYIKGINIGSWFIPESWLAPDVYAGLDEWESQVCGLVAQYGQEEAERRMLHHYETWITERDFDFFVNHNINSVRVPIGYWNVVDDPYRMMAPATADKSLKYLDWLFEMTSKRGISVLVDFHGLVGSQNSWDHSGCGLLGINWRLPENRNLSLSVVDIVASRYLNYSNFLGIEIINEPAEVEELLHHKDLESYYHDAYHVVRAHSDTLLVIISDLWSDYFNTWNMFKEPNYYNFGMDWHLYDWDNEPNHDGHVQRTAVWKLWINQFITKYPIIIGEWSCSESMQENKGSQEFLSAQLSAWSNSMGNYYWNFRAPNNHRIWSMEAMIEDGYNFTS